MAKVKKVKITVNSNNLTEGQLEEKRQKVKKWQEFGYPNMTILYYLKQEVSTLSFTFKSNENEEEYVVNIG